MNVKKQKNSQGGFGTSLVVQWLRLQPPKAGGWVRSLIRELDPTCHKKDRGFCMSQLRPSTAKQINIKKKKNKRPPKVILMCNQTENQSSVYISQVLFYRAGREIRRFCLSSFGHPGSLVTFLSLLAVWDAPLHCFFSNRFDFTFYVFQHYLLTSTCPLNIGLPIAWYLEIAS